MLNSREANVINKNFVLSQVILFLGDFFFGGGLCGYQHHEIKGERLDMGGRGFGFKNDLGFIS